MLFKWDSKISLEPDLEELAETCRETKDWSFLTKSFFEYVKEKTGIDLKDIESTHADSLNSKNNFI